LGKPLILWRIIESAHNKRWMFLLESVFLLTEEDSSIADFIMMCPAQRGVVRVDVDRR